MGYYMRFIATDQTETKLSTLEQALKELDAGYSIAASGELKHGDDLYGVVEINLPGDGLFDGEIGELKEFVEEVRGRRRGDVLKTLDEARAIIAVQVLWEDRQPEATLQRLDPLWQWVISHRKGLLQADGEGYYDHSGLILKVE
jgi:hypothetical protein